MSVSIRRNQAQQKLCAVGETLFISHHRSGSMIIAIAINECSKLEIRKAAPSVAFWIVASPALLAAALPTSIIRRERVSAVGQRGRSAEWRLMGRALSLTGRLEVAAFPVTSSNRECWQRAMLQRRIIAAIHRYALLPGDRFDPVSPRQIHPDTPCVNGIDDSECIRWQASEATLRKVGVRRKGRANRKD